MLLAKLDFSNICADMTLSSLSPDKMSPGCGHGIFMCYDKTKIPPRDLFFYKEEIV